MVTKTEATLPAKERKALLVLIFIGIDNDGKDSLPQAGPFLRCRLIREESLVDMYFLLQNEFGPAQHAV